MYQYFIIIVIVIFIYASVSWILRLHTAFFWLNKERSLHKETAQSDLKVYILIPVLFEAQIIEDTAEYFYKNFLEKRKNIYLVFITTEKERVVGGHRSDTIDLVEKITKRLPEVLHIHFPKSEGKMSHQLNFSIATLKKNKQLRNTDLLAIYNADSRPEKNTFEWVKNRATQNECELFQQYGCYTGNITSMKCMPYKSMLVSGALWQTRWAIGFEIFNALKQLKFITSKKSLKLNYPFNYFIGHGFFTTVRMLEKVGGFNEIMHNEDAVLGLQFCDLQEPFTPIPYFDISDSPDSIGMLYKQKSNWYFGPLQAYVYMGYLLKNSTYSLFRKSRLFLLSTKLFLHAMFWIIGPTLIFLAITFTIIKHDFLYLSIILASFIFFAISNMISYILVTKLNVKVFPINLKEIGVLTAKGFLFFYLLHGASAYRGLSRYIKQYVSGSAVNKEKTMLQRLVK